MRVACAGTDAGVSLPLVNAGPCPVGSARGGPFVLGAAPGESRGDSGRLGVGSGTGAPAAGAAAGPPSATSLAPSRGQKRVVPP